MGHAYCRFAAISGSSLVFTAEDDLWSIPAAGGTPVRLTFLPGLASHASFSPDGEWLAFSSTHEGGREVYCMPAAGGEATRLTHLGSSATVLGWADDRIVFDTAARSPFTRRSEVWSVARTGGAPSSMGIGPAIGFTRGADGRTAICRNMADIARWKRYRGGRVGAIWVDTANSGTFEHLATEGNVAAPMWVGERLFFISDHAYYGNIYSVDAGGGDLRAHTTHSDFCPRFAATDGTRIAYCHGGDLRILDPASGTDERVPIDWRSGCPAMQRRFVASSKWLEGAKLAADGDSVVLTVRGKVARMKPWEGAVRQVGERHGTRYRLSTPHPDGERIISTSDDGGEDALCILSPAGAVHADVGGRILELALDPKGEKIALATHNHSLVLYDCASGEQSVIDRSGQGRHRNLTWSPDGAWLAFTAVTHRMGQASQIMLYEVATGTLHAVTDGRYCDWSPSFDPKGRFLYFLSTREFQPVYDSSYFDLGFPYSTRPYLVTLQQETASPFRVAEVGAGSKKPAPDDSSDEAGTEGDDKAEETLVIELDGLADRIVAFPIDEGRYQAICGVENGVLLQDEPIPRGGKAEAPKTLSLYDLGKRELSKRFDAVDAFELSAAGDKLLYRSGKKLRIVPVRGEVKDGPPSPSSGWIDVDRFRPAIEPRTEYLQMFRETWRLTRDHFWTEDLSGIDWAAVWERYRPVLDRVGSRSEYSDLVWEMVGELGTSHAYEMNGDYTRPPQWSIGHLGADLAWSEGDQGYRVERVIRGEPGAPNRCSPLSEPGVGIRAGDVLYAIDGVALTRTQTPGRALLHRAGQEVEVEAGRADERRTVSVKTLSTERSLRYRDWVIQNRRAVHAATGARIGYVHVPDMGKAGFSEFHRDYLIEAGRDGLIVDVRFNGGGHVSQLLLEKLSRRIIAYQRPRWGPAVPYPDHAVEGPVVALTDENAGSDGDIFSHSFKLLGLGPLIGNRTWGGVIGIWPRFQHVDGSVTTQPEYSFWFEDVGWAVENGGTEPDIPVDIAPQDYGAGRDPQLEVSIRTALELLEAAPPSRPTFDGRPYLGPPQE